MAIQKYFLAILPPAPLSEQIRGIKEQVATEFGSKGALRSPAHITLHMPFEYDDAREKHLIETLDQFRDSDSFLIKLQNFDAFEPRVIFIHVEPNQNLTALQKHLVRHVKTNLNLYNQAESMRGFHPHITIAFRDLKKPVFYEAMKRYGTMAFDAAFSCRSFWLLKSDNGQWIPHHEFVFAPSL